MQTLLLEAFGPLLAAIVLFALVTSARRSWLRLRNRHTPEQLQAARDAFRSRLVHPNAELVEHSLGAMLPQRLIALYTDHPLVLTEQIEIRNPAAGPKDPAEWIEAFLPLDMESQQYTLDVSRLGWGKGFCFATDGAENFYWIPASGERQTDAPVFFASHDPQASEQVADSLEQFVSWPRTLHAEDS